MTRLLTWGVRGTLFLIACALLWRVLGYPEPPGALVYLAYPLVWTLESLEQLFGVTL
jgi:hypothetical protein